MANYYIAPESSFDATADAIRAKTGSQAAIEWTEDGFADAIADIQTGNRDDLTEPKDVDFIDFDGRLLYSYTAQEFLALESLPANPSYPGLTAQGWNWTLADAKAFVGDYGALVIGQSYTTDNGKTRIYLNMSQATPGFFPHETWVYLTMFSNSSALISWGDGNTTSVSNTTASDQLKISKHQYTAPDDYIIEIAVETGSVCLGHLGANASIFEFEYNGNTTNAYVKKIEIGSGITKLGRQPFSYMKMLESVSIPVSCISMDENVDFNMFSQCYMLSGIVFPHGTTGRDRKMFASENISLKYISVPKTMTKIHISNPPRLRKFTIFSLEPVNSTASTVTLRELIYLTHAVVPGTYLSTPSESFLRGSYRKFFVPASVTSLGNRTFDSSPYCVEYHFASTVPPTMSNTNVFTGIRSDAIIYVPYSADHSILEAYQTATNWSTYASKIQEEPQ